MRLDAYLARAGLASRREARGLIRRGAVLVDGAVCRDAMRRIAEEQVSVEGRPLESPATSRDFAIRSSW